MADYNTVAAYFPSQSSIESAITKLKEAGFQSSQIGVAAATSGSLEEAGGETTAYKAGKTAGSAWERFKGIFEGNAAEPYAGEKTSETFNDNVLTPDPGYEAEDLHGSLTGLSVSDEHSRYMSHRLGSGEGGVITVNAAGRKQEALDILEESGGDVGAAAADYDYGTAPTTTDSRNIQLFGEVLRVHKDRIQSGEVKIRKEVHTTMQTIEVPVTREELVVERVPISGQTAATGTAFESDEIRIPLSEERASVTKEAVVREEIRIGKKEVTNVESLSEQVRSEELQVDQDINNPVKTGSY